MEVSIQNLSVSYRERREMVEILSGLSLHLAEGEICAIVGRSGGGKSTLLQVLSGLNTAYTGEVRIGTEAPNPKRHQIAFVPQHYGLPAWKRVGEQIALPRQIGKRVVERELETEILHQLGLDNLLHRYPHELSGGQRQRVALARAFVMRPDLLLLDEAFSALDQVTAQQSISLFRRLWERYPVTTLFVTHNPREAIQLADRTLILGGTPGRIIAELSRPSQPEQIAHTEERIYTLLSQDLPNE